jgi:hypothetical protein
LSPRSSVTAISVLRTARMTIASPGLPLGGLLLAVSAVLFLTLPRFPMAREGR